MATHTAMAQGSDASMRSSLERRLGILHFVSTKEHGWSGQTRTRFTDFQVNEITKDGKVVHLNALYNNARELVQTTSHSGPVSNSAQSTLERGGPISATSEVDAGSKSQGLVAEQQSASSVEEPPSGSISESDKCALVDLVGQTTTDELIDLYTKIQTGLKANPKPQHVTIATTSDKSQRSRVHAEIRRIFGGKIDTSTISSESIKAAPARGGDRQRGNRSANSRAQGGRRIPTQNSSGPYLHFSLYKENKDTMDALTHIAKTLRVHPKVFGVAGTKDRRAVTVQRVSIKGRSPGSLVFLNERLNNMKVGDFDYAQHPIRLNDHDGNEFAIVLKNCTFSSTQHLSFDEQLRVAKSTIDSAIAQVTQHGFINYYGTQRFGTHQIGTHEVGMKILQEDFSGAIQALLSYDPLLLKSSQDEDHTKPAYKEDISRAQACSTFLETKDSKAALDYLPPRCYVERAVIQHMGKSPADFIGALMTINRSMRTMYGHAYQSLVWNFVASKRWSEYGSQVIAGDLVLVKSNSATTNHNGRDEEADHLGCEDEISAAQNSGFVPHAITEDDIQDGKYSIYDVILPSPGWDVVYPPNKIGNFYAEFMGRPDNGGLDPHNMRRRQRDFSLPGSYRKLMGKLKKIPTASVQAYSNDLEQLIPTDLDIIRSRKSKKGSGRDAGQLDAATSWRAFAENVQQDELQKSKARATHHEAEDLDAPARVNDTWVQTSVDGSNKRIKIAKHNDSLMNESGPANTDNKDSIQTSNNTHSHVPEGPDTDTAAIDQQNGASAIQDQQLTNNSLGSSINTEITAQVRTMKPILYNAIHQVMAFLRTTANSIFPKSALQPNQPTPNQVPEGHQPPNDTDTPTTNLTSTIATDTAGPIKSETFISADSARPEKIAVILRFALDTSQYATIVIRELQGTPSVNDNSGQALDDSV